MAHRIQTGGSKGHSRRFAARCLIGAAGLLAAAVAVGTASPSLADRIWSDAASVKATVSDGLLHARHWRTQPIDAVTDDYVQGLIRLGIVKLPAQRSTDTRSPGG